MPIDEGPVVDSGVALACLEGRPAIVCDAQRLNDPSRYAVERFFTPGRNDQGMSREVRMSRSNGVAGGRAQFGIVIDDEQHPPLPQQLVDEFLGERAVRIEQGLQLAADCFGQHAEDGFAGGDVQVEVMFDQHRLARQTGRDSLVFPIVVQRMKQ